MPIALCLDFINLEKNLKNVIQSEEFNMKESRCYNVSVSINYNQDLKKMLSIVVRLPIDVYRRFITSCKFIKMETL